MKRQLLFFTAILIEGYAVLASELLAIRQLSPFVGSGTETIAIVISAVLMPLAIGYYKGGQSRGVHSIRKRLIHNVTIATAILAIGLSYIMLEVFFALLSILHITNYSLQAALYCTAFIVYPVYLLGQTIPLISHYFSSDDLSAITGKMLFFSTLGSFLGSIFSTLVLMSTIGVHNTVIVTLFLLVVLGVLLSRRWFSYHNAILLIALGFTYAANNNQLMAKLHIVSNNNYNTVSIHELNAEERILNVNRSASSKYTPHKENRFDYLAYIEDHIINSLPQNRVNDILVIGAGGFTVGLHDNVNRYDFIDIDGSLKDIAEQHLLRQKLGANKTFYAESARPYLYANTKLYDLIILDAYSNQMNVPEQLVTQDFFRTVKRALKPKGIVAFNVIAMEDFSDNFSVKIDNTFRNVFTPAGRQALNHEPGKRGNIIYTYYNRVSTEDIYTDDRNDYFRDR